MNKIKIKRALNILLIVITIGLLVGTIAGVAMGCNHALYLILPAFATSLYPIVNLVSLIKAKFKFNK